MLRIKLNNFLKKDYFKISLTFILIFFNIVFLNVSFISKQTYSRISQNRKTGILKPVVLLVEFPDLEASYEISTPDFYNKILFEKNNNSLYDYFYENSQSKLEIAGVIYTNEKNNSNWFMLPKEYKFYENGYYGMGKYPNNTQKLVEDAIEIADEVIDFSKHDGDNDGFVDGIIIIYAGSSVSTKENRKIYHHKWEITPVKKDNKYINKYIVMSEYKYKPGDFVIGPLCHEIGHLLGGIDLYDLDSYSNYVFDNQISNGLGKWSIMSYGMWGKNKKRGDTPSHFDAWHKVYFGWIDPIVIDEKEKFIILEPIESINGKIYKIPLNDNPEEYLLIENRQKINFDLDSPGEGILIYHIDESMENNSYAYSPFDETPNVKHYKVSIIQKDGNYELERGKNFGDNHDTFNKGDEFILNHKNKTLSYYNININVIINIIEKIEFSYKIKIQIIN